MKNIFYKSILFLFVAGAFTSCEDELNQVPFDSFATENAFSTASDFDNAIRGAYSALNFGGYYGGSYLSRPDVLADNVTISQRGRMTQRGTHEWIYTAQGGFSGTYQACYTVIYRANQVLQFIDGFDGPSKANIRGEALALRAMAHFDAVRFFGKLPTQSGDANGSLGIVYRTTPDPTSQDARGTVAATYAAIVDDLIAARGLINTSNPDGRMNRNAVNLLLSRAYLYMGQWQNAADAAAAVSTAVAPRSSVVGVWEDANQDGLVFYIPNTNTELNNNIGVQWSQGSMQSLIPEYVASYQLDQLYLAGNDVRKDAYIFDGSTPGANGQPVNGIKKLLGRGTQFNGLVDIKILRAAEARLNRAEALNNLGGQDGAALAALNDVRSKRYTAQPTNGETGTALRDAIRLERRLEFAFESKRWFDLKRWGLGVTRANFGDLEGGAGTPSDVLTLAAGNFRFQLPIAQSSIIVNPNLQQNPGY
jgi:hypothetical protein